MLRVILAFVRRTLLCLLLCALATSCGAPSLWYAPPAQRPSDFGKDPPTMGAYIDMENPEAAGYIVRDISSERGIFRWAYKAPEIRLRVEDARNLKFAFEFAIPEVTFKDTGPVTVSAALGGRVVGSIQCPRAGDYRFEKPVPDGWIQAQTPIHVTFNAQPRWVAPLDGNELSFLLKNVGFFH
jgi:hypothetical protein